MYHDGESVKKDYTKALEWYLKAAKQGIGNAMRMVGYGYNLGVSGEKDKQIGRTCRCSTVMFKRSANK